MSIEEEPFVAPDPKDLNELFGSKKSAPKKAAAPAVATTASKPTTPTASKPTPTTTTTTTSSKTNPTPKNTTTSSSSSAKSSPTITPKSATPTPTPTPATTTTTKPSVSTSTPNSSPSVQPKQPQGKPTHADQKAAVAAMPGKNPLKGREDSTSFLMELYDHQEFFNQFVEFVQQNHSEDYPKILFWSETKEFERNPNPKAAQKIWQRFLAKESRENIRDEFFDQELKSVEKAIATPKASTFATMANSLDFVLRDLYKKFRESSEHSSKPLSHSTNDSNENESGSGDMTASLSILQSIFPEVDEDIISASLEAHDGDVPKTQAFLQKSGYKPNNQAAKNYETSAQRRNDKNFDVQKEDFAISTGVHVLQTMFPSLDKDLLAATLKAHNGDVSKAGAYLFKTTATDLS